MWLPLPASSRHSDHFSSPSPPRGWNKGDREKKVQQRKRFTSYPERWLAEKSRMSLEEIGEMSDTKCLGVKCLDKIRIYIGKQNIFGLCRCFWWVCWKYKTFKKQMFSGYFLGLFKMYMHMLDVKAMNTSAFLCDMLMHRLIMHTHKYTVAAEKGLHCWAISLPGTHAGLLNWIK